MCGMAGLSWGGPARACSVCFGDPDSEMARGLAAGVIMLAAVIGVVLLGVVGVGLVWIQRGRCLQARGDGNVHQEICFAGNGKSVSR